MVMEREEVAAMARFYRKHLVDDVIGFWEPRTGDPEYPGYLVPFDREGHSTGTDKNIWCQGRQTYMFAAMYHHIAPRSAWMDLARRGRDFLVLHAHAGGGRWHYLLRRDCSVIDATRSILSDAFAVMGLCQYAVASGRDEDLPLIRMAFDTMERNFHTPGFAEFHHFKRDPACKHHGLRMIMIGLAPLLRQVLGAARIGPLIDQCLHEILYVFAKDDHYALFETLDGNGNVMPDTRFQTLNPGHALESMWFCMEEGLHRRDPSVIDRAIQVAGWAYENGLDRVHDGLFAFTTPTNSSPPEALPNLQISETWDSKIWWVHSEALYALALAARIKNDATMWQRFLAMHAYTQKYFADPVYGEWYSYLYRDGMSRITDKGTWIKCAFHVPRDLLKLTLLLEG